MQWSGNRQEIKRVRIKQRVLNMISFWVYSSRSLDALTNSFLMNEAKIYSSIFKCLSVPSEWYIPLAMSEDLGCSWFGSAVIMTHPPPSSPRTNKRARLTERESNGEIKKKGKKNISSKIFECSLTDYPRQYRKETQNRNIHASLSINATCQTQEYVECQLTDMKIMYSENFYNARCLIG